MNNKGSEKFHLKSLNAIISLNEWLQNLVDLRMCNFDWILSIKFDPKTFSFVQCNEFSEIIILIVLLIESCNYQFMKWNNRLLSIIYNSICMIYRTVENFLFISSINEIKSESDVPSILIFLGKNKSIIYIWSEYKHSYNSRYQRFDQFFFLQKPHFNRKESIRFVGCGPFPMV